MLSALSHQLSASELKPRLLSEPADSRLDQDLPHKTVRGCSPVSSRPAGAAASYAKQGIVAAGDAGTRFSGRWPFLKFSRARKSGAPECATVERFSGHSRLFRLCPYSGTGDYFCLTWVFAGRATVGTPVSDPWDSMGPTNTLLSSYSSQNNCRGTGLIDDRVETADAPVPMVAVSAASWRRIGRQHCKAPSVASGLGSGFR